LRFWGFLYIYLYFTTPHHRIPKFWGLYLSYPFCSSIPSVTLSLFLSLSITLFIIIVSKVVWDRHSVFCFFTLKVRIRVGLSWCWEPYMVTLETFSWSFWTCLVLYFNVDDEYMVFRSWVNMDPKKGFPRLSIHHQVWVLGFWGLQPVAS